MNASKPSPDVVLDRLIAINREIDQKLEQYLRGKGLTRAQLEQMAEAGRAIPAAQRAAVEAKLASKLPPVDARFARINDPELTTFSARGLRMIRV